MIGFSHFYRMVVLLYALMLIGGASAGRAQVAGPDALHTALREATGGETILLSGGDYGKLELIDGHNGARARFESAVTIAAADPANPPVFSGVDVRNASNLAFEGVMFDYTFNPNHPIYFKPFSFRDVENLAIRNVVIDGDLARGVSAAEDGRGWADGLSIIGARNVTVENVEIARFHRGLLMGGVDRATVRGNDLHSLRMDGMNFSAVREVLIEDNLIRDFNRSSLASDHADMIQFWTSRTTRPSVGVVIRGNVLNSGLGGATQTIFMRNEMVDQGLAGEEMFYRDIIIEENVVINGQFHGITVGETDGLLIRHNTLLRNPAYGPGLEDRDRTVRLPAINVAAAARRVTITDNIAVRFPEAQPGWYVEGNLPVQDVSPMQPGYYHRLFVGALTGAPDDLENFVYLPAIGEGRPEAQWPGATLLRPGADRSLFR